MAYEARNPYEQFVGANGQPLNSGQLYIGVANMPAETNPIQVYWDEAGTITATQPLSISGGYVVRSGTPAQFYTNAAEYSATLKTNGGSTVWSNEEVKSTPFDAALVGYDDGTVQDVLDSAKPLANYAALRAYTGRATDVRITEPGIAGFFRRNGSAADNGGTVIKDGSNRSWERVFEGAVNVLWFGASPLLADNSSHISAAANSLINGQTLIVPDGNFSASNYITINGKNIFSIIMHGTIVPSGGLNNVNTALFNFVNCSNFSVEPKIINANYASTLNCIRLQNCQNVSIERGIIDVKYNSYDGSAGIQIAANTTSVKIRNNFIRAGFGVLGNNVAGVSNITVHNNEFVGQKFYGSTGTGDAVEANFPTNESKNWFVNNNVFRDYETHNPGGFDARIICVGMANVKGFSVNDNTFIDNEMECVHLEDGTSHGTVSNNKISSGVMGIHLQPNSTRMIKDVVVSGNQITLGAQPAEYSVDYGCAILVNVNPAGTGYCSGVTVSDNSCNGTSLAQRGIAVYDCHNFTVTGNSVSDFPRAGYDIRRFGGLGTGVKHGTIVGNVSTGNGWNYILGGLGSSGPFNDMHFDESNKSFGSLFGLNYVSLIDSANRSRTIVRYPYSNTGITASVGDVMVASNVKEDYSLLPVITGGTTGAWKVSDGVINFSKSVFAGSIASSITFASYGSAAIPVIVEIGVNSIASSGTSFEYACAKYAFSHLTSVSAITAFGTDDKSAGITIVASRTGLTATFTVTFSGNMTSVMNVKIIQAEIHNPLKGGVVSIQ